MKLRLLSVFVFLQSGIGMAQVANSNSYDDEKKGINIADLVEMSGDWFIAYRDGIKQIQADENVPVINEHTSSFVLKRSYFTLKKDLNAIFSVRYTMDLTIDTEGDDAGNVETRLKYLYLMTKPKLNSKVLTGTAIEVGMVHRPWLDYEQKMNTYRVQDNMFIERNRIFNSADFGLTVTGNIGPKMDEEFLKSVNGVMKGKYASYSLGIYNGGGYSGIENNNNKVIAGRLTLRPFANTLPQLQISGYFNRGKGNSEFSPDFNQVLGFLAYTEKQFKITAQLHDGVGDFRARYVDPVDPSRALDNHGYSFFGEYKFGNSPFSLWGRFDEFKVEEIEERTQRVIGGLTYRANKMIRLILNTEHTTVDDNTEDTYELNLEISF
ncbi:hypothetical protein [Zobellia uliginosa]|uniref:hypothetical protein n=1 Tax=Zobellia uliginosa TaxID=143224 RepID=UPI001C077D20|nr:hypothetical protein [Zobellia uliginosa]MBU2947320.1 hypothetical protein [Zobellia uliginosa]